MEWINGFGLVIIMMIMIPNIIFGLKNKKYQSKYKNKFIEVIEQIGRFGSMFFMIFNFSIIEFNVWFNHVEVVYLIVNSVFTVLYCFTWVIYFRRETRNRAMILAILPTCIFLFSGVIQNNVLLTLTSLLFGVGHITITYNNNL